MNRGTSPNVTLRPMMPADLPETIDMWVTAWRVAYPAVDFEARRGWIVERIRELESAGAQALVALMHDSEKWGPLFGQVRLQTQGGGQIVGLLVVDPLTGYLDQLVVAPDAQRRGIAAVLLAEARGISPQELSLHVNQDNTRAIAFYEKHGFVKSGTHVNSRSGAPVFLMKWKS
jgi:putative acetyltransferase